MSLTYIKAGMIISSTMLNHKKIFCYVNYTTFGLVTMFRHCFSYA